MIEKGWRPRLAKCTRSMRPFVLGAVTGTAVIFGGQYAINQTTLADGIIAPLLTSDTEGGADAIVVLGAGVVGECGTNNNGVRRVLRAAELWRDRRAPLLVFTGGRPADGGCAIAAAMAALAESVGVPREAMLLESESHSTHENAVLAEPLLRARGVRRVLLVTDRLHMRRSEGVFKRLGIEVGRASVPIYEGHANNTEMLTAGLREFAALTYYRRQHWIGDPATSRPTQATRSESIAGTTAVMEQAKMNPQGPIVLLGASYAGGWRLGDVAGVPTHVRGVSGQQSFEMLARFDADVVAARPRAVILWGFINDIFRAPGGNVDAAKARVRESYLQMIAQARQHGIEPVIATEVTMRPDDSWPATIKTWIGGLLGKESYQARINRNVLEMNRWLVDTAQRERLLLLDLHGALAENGGARRREYTTDDGSHITDAGYAALSAYARPILEKHLGSR